jgi:hypothetical protein
VQTLENVAAVDRRLGETDVAGHALLAVLAHTYRPHWRLGSLLAVITALGHENGIEPVIALCRHGLLFPDLPEGISDLRNLEQWFQQGSAAETSVFTTPLVAGRADQAKLTLPTLDRVDTPPLTWREADGLDWPLRLASLWQQVADSPLRQTIQGGYFKRDLEKLRGDTLLTTTSANESLPDAGVLTAEVAKLIGVLRQATGELSADSSLACLEKPLALLLEELWGALLRVESWQPDRGWQAGCHHNPYPAAYVLGALVLSRVPHNACVTSQSLRDWIHDNHPFWSQASGGRIMPPTLNDKVGPPLDALFRPIFELGLIKVGTDGQGRSVVCLSRLGRNLLSLIPSAGESPQPKTLLIQPNLEIIAYRQGLTPALIAALTQFAAWKSIGAACTLQVQPESIYCALEKGWTLDRLSHFLQQHGTREVPSTVLDCLRTWVNKRDRISVYSSATLFEFASAEELDDALCRGLPGYRITEHIAAVADESKVDYRQFRLLAARDYAMPPEPCVSVETDGVSLLVDAARADLLLGIELSQFAEPVYADPGPEHQRYLITPSSLAKARKAGYPSVYLEQWFAARTGKEAPAAVRLLIHAPVVATMALRRQLLLHVGKPEVADGLLQWPGTRGMFEGRVGPGVLVVLEENLEALRSQLQQLGIPFSDQGNAAAS